MDQQISVSSSIYISDLICMICDALDHEQTIEFVKRLDEEVADWDYTEELAKWYAEQIKVKDRILEKD